MLYPELSNLYGDAANIKYLQESHPETKIIETHLGDKPFFIDGKVDLVYRGTLTEHGQQLFIEKIIMISIKIYMLSLLSKIYILDNCLKFWN